MTKKWKAEDWRDMSGNFIGFRVVKRNDFGQVHDVNAGFVVNIYDPAKRSHLMMEKAKERAEQLNAME